ncbi:MAG: hypothetical protein IKN47_04765 [Lachnospiraceae bacterium]|nr:hypothetical protein [Lachnospiraceae bacterium]
MADELIRVNNSSYGKYEDLLIKRDALRKEAFQYDRAYIREFGNLILELFELKLDCIRKKKTIEYCQIFVNKGQSVDQDALQAYLQKEMEEYQKQLDDMIKDNEAAKESHRISEVDLLKIKRIYHRLVKKIHPDINPLTEENDDLLCLWMRLKAAYNCNDLKEMEEVEVLVNLALEKLDLGTLEISIPDIDEKIAEIEEEIEKIKNTDPYRYKYLLEDINAVKQKKEDLEKEIREYIEYGEQLDEILDGLMQKGVRFTWRMN